MVASSSPVKSLILISHAPAVSLVSVAISPLRIGSSGALPSASAMAARRLISGISTVCAVAVSEIETNIHRSNKDLTLMNLSPSLEPCGALCPVAMVLKSTSDFFKGQPKKPSESKSSPLPDNNWLLLTVVSFKCTQSSLVRAETKPKTQRERLRHEPLPTVFC